MNTASRDTCLCQDYQDGTEITELSRSYGITERRVAQILNANCVVLRPRGQRTKKALSKQHILLGLQLRTHRLKINADVHTTAVALGWSSLKLRKIEKGISEVELLDLIDISTFTNTPLSELIKS